MSNTSITNVLVSDTFQSWISKTNELIDLANENVMLAGPGGGFTVQGNSTLNGTFTANTTVSGNGTIDNLQIVTLQRSNDADEQILSSSPIRILTSVNNIIDLQTTSGNRPLLRMINGGNARWVLGQRTSSSASSFGIGTEGASTPQVTITQAGRLTATELQGNGSLITGISANNISGTLSANVIPNLSADKITSDTLDVARIPNLNADKITAGTLDDSIIPSNIVRSSRRLIPGTGINIGGSGTLEADRTISTVQLTQAQVQNSNSTVWGAVTGLRLSQAFNTFVGQRFFSTTQSVSSNTNYTINVGFQPKVVRVYAIFTSNVGGYQIGDRAVLDGALGNDSSSLESGFAVAIRGNNIILRTYGDIKMNRLDTSSRLNFSWNDVNLAIEVWS